MELYQVFEDNNQDWEDNARWTIAVFDNKEDAEAYAVAKQAQYDAEFEEAEKQAILFDNDYYEQVGDLPEYNTEKYFAALTELYDKLNKKYPLASMDTYSKHSFTVSNGTIPLNPTI